MDVDLSNKEAANQAAAGAIALPLLQVISEARNEHGMRQQQYARYRHYCAKKAHRLREILDLTHSDGTQKAAAEKAKKAKGARGKKSKKAQATAADQSADAKGHGNVFTNKTLSIDNVRDERPAQLLLFEAERAWAYSQDLRTQAFDNDNDPAIRKRGLSRLRRAVQWSSSLNDLVTALDSRFDIYARSEVAAYSVMLKGVSAFDHGQWQKALETLSVARLLLSAIAENSKSSRGEALANSFVDAGEAQMRYCAYQLGEGEQNMDAVARKTATAEVCERVFPGYDAILQALKAEGGSGAAKSEPLSLNWHGRQIPVRNPELLDAITRAQAEEAALHEAIKSGSLQDEGKAVANAERASSKVEGKRPRLSHAQRKAKKREASGEVAGAAASSSGAATFKLGGGGRTELDPFDRALSAFTDAEEVARRLVEDNTEALAKSHSARYETASKDLQTAHDYVFYRLLALRIARNARLVADVERKSERREKRAWANVEARLASSPSASAAKKSAHSSGRSRKTKRKAVASERAKPPPKKNQPGSRAKAKRSSPKTHQRRPARSGMRALRSRQAAARVARARSVAAGRASRRRARAVPSLAKLLDGADLSLTAMASIALVESEPDVSSLVEAKSAWYRSELLRHLARAFSLSNAKPQAILLLTRAQLYIRQARQAADLADDVDEEDRDFPPVLVGMEDGASTFDESDKVLESLKRQIQKEMYLSSRSGKGGKKKGSQMASSKAGQSLLDMARRYVDFDPVDLEDAKKVPQDVIEECEREQQQQQQRRGSVAGAPTAKAVPAAPRAKKVEAPPAAAAAAAPPASAPVRERVAAEPAAVAAPPTERAKEEPAVADVDEEEEEEEEEEEDEDVGDASMAYDPSNALAEEEEARLAAEAANKKKGWLGGWFGRG